MAIIIMTDDPDFLLGRINKLLREKGDRFWQIDTDNDLTLQTTGIDRAWFHAYPNAKEKSNSLVFGIIGMKEKKMTNYTYSLYHGLFITFLLNYFDQDIQKIEPTVLLCSDYDKTLI